ncbi:phosphoenolpyruvate--protein phosphotransferase [Anaerostipes sp.]|uniref:phosphoenolpyruvate--protein phosphotransferase n=1 Tax=Anaerostipes sp. TaxID=1872530 RepID=UPI0025BAD9DC|nr:phosphoenolpyruvate--protein phosphotransferase [Anaerostipes sp.]MBS7008318.1 phosphoenolpyruvate--protein phosphotransferase [Anaerostipes sp.]
MYKGIGASAGIGIGKVVVIKEQSLDYKKETITDAEAEKKRLSEAIEVFIDKTTKMVEAMKVTAGEQESEILEGHILMIQDPAIKEQIDAKIDDEKINAEAAVEEACDFFAQIFAMAEDELTQQRASDLGDIKTRLIKILLGVEEVDISAVPEGTVLVAEDLTPSMTAGINPANVEGVLTEIGGKTSHSAIICRSMEIPAVLSVENIVSIVKDGDVVVLDGTTGEAYINPEDSVLEDYKAKKAAYLEEKAALSKFIGQASQTADGHVVELVANIGGPDEAAKVVECDGEGVGLFRTEFLFMDRDSVPTEEEQFKAYKTVAETLEGKPVIIRTLDIGGDKALPYLGLETEENPFLGFRAVRFCLQRPDIYRPQLRALLRASAFGKIRIMVPLVTCVDELRAVKALLEEIKGELDAEGIAYNKDVEVGVMMETAAASLIADILAKEADFFSIGTNDLTGYTMAADRGNSDVAYLYSAYNPAVLRSIQNIISAANKEGIMAGMCGEAASDPLLVPVLLAFGLNEFSVSATAILATRKVMSLWTMDEAKALAEEVMQLATEAEVKALLEERARS